MHTEVFNNIDTLIAMSGSSLDIDEINTELISLRKQIKNKKNELEDLRSLISDARYFNASNELVDKNIEISLKNKITRFNRKLKELKASIGEIKSSEKKLHQEITELRGKLSKNEQYIDTLKIKTKNSENNKYYIELLKKEEENVKLLTKQLKEKEKAYQEVLKELELTNQALEEINANIASEKARLNDILDNLKNPNSYIDEDLKNSDNERINAIEEELRKLEKRELEILTDAKVIGTDAKELIANQEIEEALNKVKELVTIVKSKPYMDITNMSILEEELEKKESYRLELSNLIDSKNYEGIDSNTITERIEYLNAEIEKNKNNIEEYKNKINEIDKYINDNLGNKINNLELEVLKNENTIKEYRELLKDNEKSSKTKANLESAITKKEKEKRVLDDILASYKDNLLSKIEETNILNSIAEKYIKENKEYEDELTNLKKLSMLDFKTKDLIEEEKDKEELRKINEEIKQIKNRNKYDKAPNEIYDQIDMALASYKPSPSLRTEKNKGKSLEIDSLFESNPPKESNNNRIKVIEMIPVETIKKSDGGN